MALYKFTPPSIGRNALPSFRDLIALSLVIGVIVLMAYGARVTTVPLSSLSVTSPSLDPVNLPIYALRTMLRMLLALVLSLIALCLRRMPTAPRLNQIR